jgi:hypothetical protein
MALSLVLALQAAAQSPLPIDFDLSRLRPDEFALDRLPGSCRRGAGEEIVVCASRPSREAYPYAEMERLFRARPIRAEMRLGSNMTGRAYLEQGPGDRGAVSNRVMFGIRLPF